jgi:hypothetical protein
VELRNLCSSPNIIRRIKSKRMGFCGECSTHGREREVMQDFGEKERVTETTKKA